MAKFIDPNHEWVEPGIDGLPTTAAFAAWPDCHWPGCDAKSCGPLGSSYCFPHTILIRGITAEEGRAQIKAGAGVRGWMRRRILSNTVGRFRRSKMPSVRA